MTGKKEYTEPKLTVHGDVNEITRNGGAPNADVENGPDGTAFPPGS